MLPGIKHVPPRREDVLGRETVGDSSRVAFLGRGEIREQHGVEVVPRHEFLAHAFGPQPAVALLTILRGVAEAVGADLERRASETQERDDPDALLLEVVAERRDESGRVGVADQGDAPARRLDVADLAREPILVIPREAPPVPIEILSRGREVDLWTEPERIGALRRTQERVRAGAPVRVGEQRLPRGAALRRLLCRDGVSGGVDAPERQDTDESERECGHEAGDR